MGRFGGEEFLVVLPNTSLENACIVAEQLRACVADTKLKLAETEEEIPPITVSAGVATLEAGESTEDLVKRADAALYAAKNNGRNRVHSEPQAKAKRETRPSCEAGVRWQQTGGVLDRARYREYQYSAPVVCQGAKRKSGALSPASDCIAGTVFGCISGEPA